ncbi:MAG TPA: amidohydrolase [Nitrospiria bacterium]|jgi:hippurate hydrolase
MDSKRQEEVFSKIISVRRDIHQNPELSWEEHTTAKTICQFLQEHKIKFKKNIAKTGVVAEFPGPPGVPSIALMADMDALPIQEETGLDFSSAHPGVMHACGHDGHTAMLLGAALLLKKEDTLPAPVKIVFQPAEEKGTWALAMIAEGILDGVGMIFGGHLDRHYKTGTVVVTEGAVNASSDTFTIEIIGQGAHGARPHESIDSVVIGSLMVMALQTIVSREVDPTYPSVVSVGRFDAGTASNVIAGRAKLE